MAFELATAKPEEKDQTKSGFDVATAQPEQQVSQLQPEYNKESRREITFLGELVGGIEGALSLGTGMIAEPISGVMGLAGAANPFAREGEGVRIVDAVRKFLTFQPRTESGKAAIEGVSGAVKPVIDKLQKVKQFIGDDAFNLTGSPALAAIATALPEATLSLFGVRAGKPFIQEAPKTSVIKDVFKVQTPTKQRIAKLIEEGVTDVETAKFKLLDAPVAPRPAQPTKLQEMLNIGGPRVVKDPAAIGAIKQGFDEGVVAAIKGSSPIDKSKMLEMVGIMEKGKKNARFAVLNRPSDVAGDSLMNRFRSVMKANKKAGKELDGVAKSLKGKSVDQAPAVEQFIDDLQDLGVNFGNDLKPRFKGSDIEGVAAAENIIKKVVNRMSQTKVPDAFDLHRLKKFIDELVTFGKRAEGLGGRTERILKNLRRNVDGLLDNNFPEYNRVNTVFSETIGAIDAFQDVAGKKLNLLSKNADKATGTLLRRLMSNTQSRVRLLDSVNEIEAVAKKFGDKFDDDLLTQILFVDELDSVFGPVARTSFAGQIKQIVIPRTSTDIAIKAGEKIIGKARGINEEAAFKSIKELLKGE